VVVTSQQIGNGIEPGRESNALLQLDEPLAIAEVPSRGADAVQNVSAEIVEPELLGKRQRLTAELERTVEAIAQHLVPRHLAEHGHLCTRARSAARARSTSSPSSCPAARASSTAFT